MRSVVIASAVVLAFLAAATVPATTADGPGEESILIGPFPFEAASDQCAFRWDVVSPFLSPEELFEEDCETSSNGTWSARCYAYHCIPLVEGEARGSREPGLWSDRTDVVGLIMLRDDLGEPKPRHALEDFVCEAITPATEASCQMELVERPVVEYIISVAEDECGEVGWGSFTRASRAGDRNTQFVAKALDLFDLCFGSDGTWTVIDKE